MSIDLCIKKLLEISELIDDNYEELMYLSRINKEDSKEYNDVLIKLYVNVQKTVTFCQNLSIEILQKMVQKLNIEMRKNPNNYYYTAAMNAVSFVLNKKYIENASKKEYDDNFVEETFGNVYQEEISYEAYQEEMPDEEKYIEDDYSLDLDDIYDEAMSVIYLEATKKVITKIKATYTTNEYERKYKNMLLKKYKTYYKYDFLSSNIFLELMSIKNRFDPFDIDIKISGDFSPIYYNEAIELITYLYDRTRGNTTPEDVCEDLFSVSVVETIIDLLDVDRLNKLKELCEEKSSKYNKFNYGNICYVKLKQKLK